MNVEKKILLLEDSIPDAEYIRAQLHTARRFASSILHVQRLSVALSLLEKEQFDLVLVDLGLPDSHGMETALTLRRRAPTVPIIVLTGLADEELAIKALQQDIQDYLVKGRFRGDDLLRSIRYSMERKRSMEALRQSEERFRDREERLRLAIEATSLGTFDFNPQTGEMIWSDMAKLHFGLAPQDRIDYDVFLSGLHPDDRERVDKIIQGAFGTGQAQYDTEYRTIGNQDGQERWLAARGRTIFNEKGEPVRFIGTTLDITERKKIENQLQVMKEELERKVEQRTSEVVEIQKRYLHAEKLSALGKLSASMAHEFNNPLQAIAVILQSLKKANIDKNDREMLELAIAESDRMKRLISNLRDFYRPSTEMKAYFDIHVLIDGLLLLLKYDFQRKKINIEREYTNELPPAFAVPDQIKQVFLNLLSNAAEACFQSGGVITISTREENERVAVAIKDTGVGIKPEDIENIFRPFYTTKAETKGTGLGLSTSYGIVKSHGGEILVESQPGEGSTFTVLLPAKKEPDIETQI